MATPSILVCDDEPNMRQLVRVILDAGYEFHEAADAAEAVELARRWKPDLAVLDVMVPGDGRAVLAELRGDPELREIPIVIMTAWAELEEAVLGLGADRFFEKPFEPATFKAAVEELLERP